MARPKLKPTARKDFTVKLRLTKRELIKVEKLANAFTEGNISAWLRYAATAAKGIPQKKGMEEG